MSEGINPAAEPVRGRPGFFERVNIRSYGIVLSFLILFVGLSLASDKFLTTRNLLNILDQSAPVGIIACGITIGIISGVFDLSAGAIFAVAAVVACKTAQVADPVFGIVLGALTGSLLGVINAGLVSLLRINSFIATLASSIVFRGIAILVTGGMIVTVTNEAFSVIGTGTFLRAKFTVWVYLAVVLITTFVLERTVLGRYFFAVGGNPEAARLSGIPVERIKAIAFMISGLCAGIAGVLAASRTSSAQPDLGMGLEFTAIAASVVGGTSIMGGEGAIWRAVLGVLILALIGNGFNLLGIDTIYQQIVQGVLIVIAVGTDQLVRARRA